MIWWRDRSPSQFGQQLFARRRLGSLHSPWARNAPTANAARASAPKGPSCRTRAGGATIGSITMDQSDRSYQKICKIRNCKLIPIRTTQKNLIQLQSNKIIFQHPIFISLILKCCVYFFVYKNLSIQFFCATECFHKGYLRDVCTVSALPITIVAPAPSRFSTQPPPNPRTSDQIGSLPPSSPPVLFQRGCSRLDCSLVAIN